MTSCCPPIASRPMCLYRAGSPPGGCQRPSGQARSAFPSGASHPRFHLPGAVYRTAPGRGRERHRRPPAETQVELPGSPEVTYPGQAPRTEWYGAEHGYRAPAPARDGDGVREGSGGRGGHYQPPEPPSRAAMRGMGALLTTLPEVAMSASRPVAENDAVETPARTGSGVP